MQVGDTVRVIGSKDPEDCGTVHYVYEDGRYAEVSWCGDPYGAILEEVSKLEVVQK